MRIEREVVYKEIELDEDDICSTCYHQQDCPLLNNIRTGLVELVYDEPIAECGMYCGDDE